MNSNTLGECDDWTNLNNDSDAGEPENSFPEVFTMKITFNHGINSEDFGIWLQAESGHWIDKTWIAQNLQN